MPSTRRPIPTREVEEALPCLVCGNRYKSLGPHRQGRAEPTAGTHATHPRILAEVEGERRTRVLHLGDYDASGEHMFSSLAEDVIAFAEAAGVEVEFERVAVTSGQIATYNLPTAPPKATDRRSFSGTATTQAEALPPDILATIVRQAIETHRDPEVHRRALAREEAERRAIRERLSRHPDPGRPPVE